jgi:hypothetical protein
MLKTRSLLLALLAVFVLSAAVAASASATTMVWIQESKELTKGIKTEADSEGGLFVMKGAPFGVVTQIECAKEKGTGWVENPLGETNGIGLSSMSFKVCTIAKPAKCELKEVNAEATLEPVLFEGAIWDRFKPVGTALTTITLEGAECVLKGKAFEVTGVTYAKSKNGPEEGTFTFKANEHTELKGGGKAFTIEGEMSLGF